MGNPPSQLVYQPQKKHSSVRNEFKELFDQGQLHTYSLGRHALEAGLKQLELPTHASVAVPAFVCRDILAPINRLGLNIKFYHVDKHLCPIDLHLLQDCQVIMAVNYFGFPQDLGPFQSLKNKSGIVIIEDNAHGFLSRSQEGSLLGTRAEIGIFSFRKTFRLVNGGGLYLNNQDSSLIPVPERGKGLKETLILKIKELLGRLPASTVFTLLKINRVIRKMRTGSEVPPPGELDEVEIPFASNGVNVTDDLSQYDFKTEIKRRRELYLSIDQFLKDMPIEKVFNELPELCSPFGFPFYCSDEDILDVQSRLSKIKMECVPWPALPDKIAESGPKHYNHFWFVRFLW